MASTVKIMGEVANLFPLKFLITMLEEKLSKLKTHPDDEDLQEDVTLQMTILLMKFRQLKIKDENKIREDIEDTENILSKFKKLAREIKDEVILKESEKKEIKPIILPIGKPGEA